MKERILGPRHSWSRALCRAGVVTDAKAFYELTKQFSLEGGVPTATRLEGLRYLADLIRVSGIEVDTRDLVDMVPASSKQTLEDPDLESEMAAIAAEMGEFDGFGFDEPEPSRPSSSPLVQFVRGVVTKWLERNEFRFLFYPIQFQEQNYYLLSTWRLKSARMPGVEWNLTGTTGSSSVIHRCGPDTLTYENDHAICITEELSLRFENLPQRHPKSIYPGTHEVDATVFVWVLDHVPHREFRFWLNEERINQKFPVRPKEDIWKKTYKMDPR